MIRATGVSAFRVRVDFARAYQSPSRLRGIPRAVTRDSGELPLRDPGV